MNCCFNFKHCLFYFTYTESSSIELINTFLKARILAYVVCGMVKEVVVEGGVGGDGGEGDGGGGGATVPPLYPHCTTTVPSLY